MPESPESPQVYGNLRKARFPPRDKEKYSTPQDEPPDVMEARLQSNTPHFHDAGSAYYTELADRMKASTEDGRPDYQIADIFTCLSILANPGGFRFLADELLKFAEAAPGRELWLPIRPDRAEMGQKVFILKMAGENAEPPKPAPEPSNEQQLKASREKLAEAGKTALIHPPRLERGR